MILKVHLEGAASYDVGDEIWQVALSDAVRAAAESIVYAAGPELLGSGTNHLRDRILAEMSEALRQVADTYRAPDGILYSLIEPSAVEDDDTLSAVSAAAAVVEEVLRFEDLPVGSLGTRRAIVRWSDGSESAGLKWYG
jgi:hypothetical protein